MDHVSLHELNKKISEVLAKHLKPSYWVVAEIGQMQTNQKGHCYLELVEKENDTIKAKTRATIWSYTYRNLSTWFHGITGQQLKTGMKILFNATIQYHEVYGFSLNIRDIDAQYTLGERAKKRQEVIQQLIEDGIFEMNKELELPIVPQRVAVISSETAAGYGDFMNQLSQNEYGYKPKIQLFNAVMQGDTAAGTIVNALHQIFEQADDFDLVAIMRGGGAALDLDCFDSYELGSHIAQFPLPVITGIGHERDETVADLVAHTKLKTPTAVSEFLLSGMRSFEAHLDQQLQLITGLLQQNVQESQFGLEQLINRFQHGTDILLERQFSHLGQMRQKLSFLAHSDLKLQEGKLMGFSDEIAAKSKQSLLNAELKLQHLEKELEVIDPENVLKRGYTITLVNGKNISKSSDIDSSNTLTTITEHLEVQSKVITHKLRTKS